MDSAAPTETPMEQEEALETASVTFNDQGIPVYEPIEVEPPPEPAQMFSTSGPRLMISQIINENFKSYAGIQALGPFHKNFSAIVGPNGSGKSNVIDSMLFVFGYRASKIRSKKLSVLIHSSDNHKKLTSCTVSVHFQQIIDTGTGDQDYETVADSQFVVSRTAFKDNTSYYKLNNKKVTYKEVASLLRSTGIDLDHNRFLILQGEVEQIAMMKPKAPSEHEDGMLEFLEDIIGSSRYKIPIEKLAARIEDLSELRGEKLKRVKVVEKERDDLEDVKNEAVKFLTLENHIVCETNKICQKFIQECTELGAQAKVKRDEVKVVLDDLNKELQEFEAKKKEKTKEYKKLWQQCEQDRIQSDKKKEEFSKFEQEDIRCREDIKHTKAKIKTLEKTLDKETKKLEELRQIPEKSEADVIELEKKIEKLEKEKTKESAKLDEVMESLKTETKDLQAEKDVKEKELIELQKTVNEARSKYSVAQSELDIYISNQKAETAKLEETKKNLERAHERLAERQSVIKQLEKEVPKAEKALVEVVLEHQQAVKEEQELSEQMRQVRFKVEDARSSMESARSFGSVVESLMTLKRNGTMPGIYGRLGNLGAIDEQYNVAISTACGALDNIVVDTIDTAQKCVEYLRRNNIGSATFIGLDKMARWKGHCARNINTPDGVPRLFDLVRPSCEEVRPAFYFALRDTLVARDLEQATRIAYGKTRYRVVTLGGQLIDLSGTMSGGGSKVLKGRMGSKVMTDTDPALLQQLEKSQHEMQEKAKICRDSVYRLEDLVEKSRKSFDEMKHALDKSVLEVQALQDQEQTLVEQLREREARVKAAAPDQKKLNSMEKSVTSLKKDFEREEAAAAVVEKAVRRLHDQILEFGREKMRAGQNRITLVQNQIDQVLGMITKAKVSIKTAQRNMNKCESKVASLKEELTENSATLEKREADFSKLEEDAAKVMREFQSAQETVKQLDIAVSETKASLAELEQNEQEQIKRRVDVQHELEKCDSKVDERKAKLRHWKGKLSGLTLHQIDGVAVPELETLSDEQLAEMDADAVQYQITLEQAKLAELSPNLSAIAEYRRKEDIYLKRLNELDQIVELRDQQRRHHDNLKRQHLDVFMAGFTVITTQLKEMYQMITLGGDAELELVDSLDPFSEGIVFSVRPPNKSWKNISNLSGGEKTLSSLALVFALHHYKPTPLYVMDEIDAALDFKNVSIVAHYIKERTRNAQFIIISLRNNMFELADRLIGIYKTYNCTKSVTINPSKISQPLDNDKHDNAPGNTAISVSN